MKVYIVTVDEVYKTVSGDVNRNSGIIPCISREVALKAVYERLKGNKRIFENLFNNFNEDNFEKLSDFDTDKDGNITPIGVLNNDYALYTYNRNSYNSVYLFKLWEKDNYINSHIEIRILELSVRE